MKQAKLELIQIKEDVISTSGTIVLSNFGDGDKDNNKVNGVLVADSPLKGTTILFVDTHYNFGVKCTIEDLNNLSKNEDSISYLFYNGEYTYGTVTAKFNGSDTEETETGYYLKYYIDAGL